MIYGGLAIRVLVFSSNDKHKTYSFTFGRVCDTIIVKFMFIVILTLYFKGILL